MTAGTRGGPNIGVMCTVCNHPQKAMIDAALTGTRKPSFRAIAASYGLKYDAVRRHMMNHVVPAAQAANPLGWQPPAGASWKEKMEALALALETGRVRSDVAAQLRLAYKELDEQDGMDAPVPITMRDVPGLAEAWGEVFMFLRRWPQARDEWAAIMRKHGLAGEG